MSLFFDADWFDAKLAARGMDRTALAQAANIDRGELHALFTNARNATSAELKAIAQALGADLIEVTLRSGVAEREAPSDADAGARIDNIEARLDAIDSWLDEMESKKRA
ncbi:MAG: helix-turn-helix domain-containing protein [Hyphomonadaceae bacterium]